MQASKVGCVETVFMAAIGTSRLAAVQQDAQNTRSVDLDFPFDGKVVVVPNTRPEPHKIGRRSPNSFTNFVVQAVGGVDDRTQIRELIDNFKLSVINENAWLVG